METGKEEGKEPLPKKGAHGELCTGSGPTPKQTLGIAHMDGSARKLKKKKKNNEMGLPSMKKHRAMPAFDLESIHKAFLARIFKTKIVIFSSMIYKIALERWGQKLL